MTDQPSAQPQVNGSTGQEPGFGIQRIYVSDLSFEAPNRLKAFQMQNWNPNVDLDFHTSANPVDGDVYEVILKVTVSAKTGKDETSFLIEVHQAGLFTLSHFPKTQLRRMLGAFCPNILFPYARQVISDLVMQGGFPPLYLAPVNFDALYDQHMAEKEKTSE